MKKMALLSAVALALVSAHGAHAGLIGKNNGTHHKYHPDNLYKVNTKVVDCDKLIGLAKKKDLVLASGQIVAGDTFACGKVAHDLNFDYYEARGAYIGTKGGLCNVWSCEGVRSSDGDNS